VPCTGSGTWARTPEELYFFDEKDLRINNTQFAIVSNVAIYLKKGGRLIYITCSVFVDENDALVAKVEEATGLKVLARSLINQRGVLADKMFVTVFGF